MVDYIENADATIRLQNLILIAESKSEIQHVQVFKHEKFGHILVIDDELQHVEAWSHLYHEPLVHLPLSFIEEPKTILIMGGGDFFAAIEALKYPSVEKVTLWDHDPEVIRLMCQVYPKAKQVMEDPRFQLCIGDALSPLKGDEGNYDLIINDCFDLVNSFNKNENDVYQSIYRNLSENGICSDLIYRNIFDEETNKSAISAALLYGNMALSLLNVPEYPGNLHILTMWGKNQNLSQDTVKSVNKKHKKWNEGKDFNCASFNPKFIPYYLYVPPYIREKFNR